MNYLVREGAFPLELTTIAFLFRINIFRAVVQKKWKRKRETGRETSVKRESESESVKRESEREREREREERESVKREKA